MLCSVEGCGVETRVLYWCEKHYRRRRRYGDPCYMHSLVCGWCGVEFEAWSSARRFCSDRCRDASRVDRSGLTCVGCGKSMWRCRTSRDSGGATCLDCRRGAPTYKPRKPVGAGRAVRCECPWCGATFMSSRADKRFCSRNCSRRAHDKRVTKDGRHSGNDYRSRVLSPEKYVEHTPRMKVFERDGWVCQLCGLPVDKSLKFPDRASATLDHIVPLALGGEHSMRNVQLAHFACNVGKSGRSEYVPSADVLAAVSGEGVV